MKNNLLFDDFENEWQKEWKDMPEFNMKPEVPILTIKINFKSKEAVEEFSKLINQRVSFNTENYWYPKLNRNSSTELKYYDDEP
jgi:hypothetical protein